MDDIVENSRMYVERRCERLENVTHEFDETFDDWTTENERLQKSSEAECNQHFRHVLDKLFAINLEVADPFVSFEKPINTRYQFKVAGKNHNERLQTLNRLKMRPPHHQSMSSLKSMDNYKSFTKLDLFASINRDKESNRCEVQSIASTSTVFTNKKIFSRALQGLRMMQMDDSDDDDDDDDEFEKNLLALNLKASAPPKNPVVCIPSGHEEDLDAFKKVNPNKNNNRFFRNKFNNSNEANKQQNRNHHKQQAKQ